MPGDNAGDSSKEVLPQNERLTAVCVLGISVNQSDIPNLIFSEAKVTNGRVRIMRQLFHLG